jgi:hypothetical protein
MAKRAKDWIPHNVLEAARRAGLSTPLWYVGRTNGHHVHDRKMTLAELADEISEPAGGEAGGPASAPESPADAPDDED